MEKIKIENKGITLVALVVTIIILLILATVSISILTGKNGIITKAENAVMENEIGAAREKLELEVYNVVAEKSDNLDVTIEEYIEHLIKEGIVKEDEVENTENEKARRVVVDDYMFYVEEKEGSIKITYEEPVGTSRKFYFDAISTSDKVVFERTSDESDDEEILNTIAPINLVIKNNDGSNYNTFDTNYEITIVDSEKFTFAEGDKITKTIGGNSKIDDLFTIELKIKDLAKTDKKVKLRVATKVPHAKTIDIDLNIEQEGAIQTIEDLLNLSIAVRGENKEQFVSKRYKMTRDLDFQDPNSYEDANKAIDKDINGDGIISDNLLLEMTTNAGFLPIGIHEANHDFSGVFNGGNHTISNLRIYKSLQQNIGLFGFTNGADIRNLTLKDGNVHTNNQTAGMLIGKCEGGKITNVTIEGGTVLALDEDITTRDTYSGGIVGFVELEAEIKNCINKSDVTTQFTGEADKYSGPAGGIAGWMANSTIEGCTNYGTIIGQKYIGGLAGMACMQDTIKTEGNGTIKNCDNYGKITTYIKASENGPGQYIGGICGYNKQNGKIIECRNHEEASISGISHIGGIAGGNYGSVTNCHNYTKNITGNSSVDRIIGLQKGTVSGNVDHAGT